MTHICVSTLTIIGSDNGLLPGRRLAIIWTNVRILLIRTLETNSNEILSEIHTFSFKMMYLKMSSTKWRQCCLGHKCVKETFLSTILSNLPNPFYHKTRISSWWRHQMEAFSLLLTLYEGNTPVTDGSPSQRPVTCSFDVFFDLRLNKRLSKQSRRRWFETASRSLWRNCNVAPSLDNTNTNIVMPCLKTNETSCLQAWTTS